MPALPLLAQCFRDGGYQAYAVGKLHVYPPRDRIGFDDCLIAEEGRPHLGAVDDYDLYLADQGHAGEQFLHGMNNNDYLHRPWHLAEALHVTNWTTREAARMIQRRDPTRPALWHVSYTHPHPPLVPLAAYLDMYDPAVIDEPLVPTWDPMAIPALEAIRAFWPTSHAAHELRAIRRAFYALCTHIDHQLGVLLGTLREQGVLDDTVILVCGDHGDMLGDFGLWAKRLFYEASAQIPMVLVGTRGDARVRSGVLDSRLVGLQDVMPTLLDLAGLPVPDSVEGISMVGERRRDVLYGECRDDAGATRMAHDGRHKLVWYPAGNVLQLFDLEPDPLECVDVVSHPAYAGVVEALSRVIARECWGTDAAWIRGGELVGFAAGPRANIADRSFGGQRGLHYPTPPLSDPARAVGTPGS